ncbi:hypothetical protein [Thermosulfuriphilus sp.]
MRCPKCNFLTFDHLSTCPHCQNDLSSIKKALGNPLPLEAVADFLTGSEAPSASSPPQGPQLGAQPESIEPSKEAPGPSGISDIDVSDLVPEAGEEGSGEDLEEIDLSALESEEFKKALDEILEEKS